MANTLRRDGVVWIITLAYLVLAVLSAVRVPDWQTPDEPAHYAYIAQLAETGRIPVIEAGDWDSAELDAYKAAGFRDVTDDDILAIEYEDHQPPLYYALSAPVYLLTDGNITALRIFSALWGMIIIWAAYGVGALMFPQRRWIGMGAAAFVAFQPMHLHILASVNNDSLAWALVGIGLFMTTAYLKDVPLAGRTIQPWHLGLLVGVGLITKATTFFMAGVVGVAILLKWWGERDAEAEFDLRDLMRRILTYLVPALALGGLWWLRNFAVYEFPDFLGLAAHDAVVVGQPRTQERIDLLGFDGYLREMTRTTFNSFWGQFGWMALPMRESWYAVIGGLLLVAFAGLGIDMAILRRRSGETTSPQQRNVWIALSLTTVLAILAYAYYNSEFQQYQGRYMFTLLIPLGIWLALGVDAWRRLLAKSAPGLLVPAAFGIMLAFNLYLLWRVIPPNL